MNKANRIKEILHRDIEVIKPKRQVAQYEQQLKDRAGGIRVILNNIVIERSSRRIERLYMELEEQKRVATDLIDRTMQSGTKDRTAIVWLLKKHLRGKTKEITDKLKRERKRVNISDRDSVLIAGCYFRDLVLFTHTTDEVIFKQYRDLMEPHRGSRERAKSDLHQKTVDRLSKVWKKPTRKATEQAKSRGSDTYREDIDFELNNGDNIRLPYTAFSDLLHFCHKRDEGGKYDSEKWVDECIYFEYQHFMLWRDRTERGRAKSNDHQEIVRRLCEAYGVTPDMVKKAIDKGRKRRIRKRVHW